MKRLILLTILLVGCGEDSPPPVWADCWNRVEVDGQVVGCVEFRPSGIGGGPSLYDGFLYGRTMPPVRGGERYVREQLRLIYKGVE